MSFIPAVPACLSDEERELVDVLQGHAGALGYGEQRVLGDVELDADFVGEALVKAAQQGAAAGEPDAVADDVGVKLGRSLLEGAEDGGLDFGDGLLDAVRDFLV